MSSQDPDMRIVYADFIFMLYDKIAQNILKFDFLILSKIIRSLGFTCLQTKSTVFILSHFYNLCLVNKSVEGIATLIDCYVNTNCTIKLDFDPLFEYVYA